MILKWEVVYIGNNSKMALNWKLAILGNSTKMALKCESAYIGNSTKMALNWNLNSASREVLGASDRGFQGPGGQWV